MTILKTTLLAAVAIAILATPLAVQHRLLQQSRDEIQQLRAQADLVPALQGENERLSNRVAAQSLNAPADDRTRELSKLHGEIARLRERTNQLVKALSIAASRSQTTAQPGAPAPVARTVLGADGTAVAPAQTDAAPAPADVAPDAASAPGGVSAQGSSGVSVTGAVTPEATASDQAKLNACINNLRLIDAAKQQWALENGKPAAAVPGWADIQPYLGRGPNGDFPACPSHGQYTIGAVADRPTCTVAGHALP